MKFRTLGRTGVMVSEVGQGTWGMGGKNWKGSSDDDAVKALQAGVNLGLNFIDTALAYGDGHAERLIPAALGETRHDIVIATKVPPLNRLWPAKPGVGIGEVFPCHHILQSTETSLRNLAVDRIDLQQLHVWNEEWVEQHEWRQAFETLKASGKVRFVGVSVNDHAPNSVLSLVQTGLVDSIQVIYNIFDQTPEDRLFEECRHLDVGVIARVPLDEGALTGSVTRDTIFPEGDFRSFYFRGDRREQIHNRICALRADLGDLDLATTALRFCLSNPDVSTVIPGMRTLKHVQMNLAASALGPLATDTLRLLRRHAWPRNFAT